MRPYYTDKILMTASREELAKIRVALSCWLNTHKDWEKSKVEEDTYYWKEMNQLYVDTTTTLDSLPF